MPAGREDLQLPNAFCILPDAANNDLGVQRALRGPSRFVRGALNAGARALKDRPNAWQDIASSFNTGNLIVRVTRGQRPSDVGPTTSLVGISAMAEVRAVGDTLDLAYDDLHSGYAGLRFVRQADGPWVPAGILATQGADLTWPVIAISEFDPTSGTVPEFEGRIQFNASPLAWAAFRLSDAALAGELFESPDYVEVLPSKFPES
jgi:hypothetical protein